MYLCNRHLACAQQLDNLLRVLMGQALHVGDAAGGQGTGQHHDTDSGHAQRRGAGVRGPGKGAGDDADGWYAAGFGRYSVVETPRRAGPSISDPMDDGIALHHQRVDGLSGAGGTVAKLGRVDDLLDPVRLFQNVL